MFIQLVGEQKSPLQIHGFQKIPEKWLVSWAFQKSEFGFKKKHHFVFFRFS